MKMMCVLALLLTSTVSLAADVPYKPKPLDRVFTPKHKDYKSWAKSSLYTNYHCEKETVNRTVYLGIRVPEQVWLFDEDLNPDITGYWMDVIVVPEKVIDAKGRRLFRQISGVAGDNSGTEILIEEYDSAYGREDGFKVWKRANSKEAWKYFDSCSL